ncbi:DUF4157 domain-containing protein [Nostoc sp. UIC 10607]|uniref:eCIS core domain-containing protein n=1 Tax=Nostoc sp. UIC 10607 TaxID=3045935 RepID=UPI0039A2E17B
MVRSDRHSEGQIPPVVKDVLRSPGQPLDPETQQFMESRFGHNFSQVRVHTDVRATESTCALDASAYTVERDIVFGAEQYKPQTLKGKSLLAHELAHTLQQKKLPIGSFEALKISQPDELHEQEAD